MIYVRKYNCPEKKQKKPQTKLDKKAIKAKSDINCIILFQLIYTFCL